MWKKAVWGFLLLAGLALAGGYLVTGKQSTSESAVANASPESTASLAGPTSASVTADPVPTATQPPMVSTDEPPMVSPSATLKTDPVEPTVEIATATPTADLPVAPVPGARAPDFTLTDLNGNEVSLSGLRGQVVLLNFWATW
jgi:hypothetical protein